MTHIFFGHEKRAFLTYGKDYYDSFKDFLILLLSLLESIASIASIYLLDPQDQGKLALIILVFLLGLSMCHDWYYTHTVRQKERYIHIQEDLNTICSQIRDRSDSVQDISNIFASICGAISTIFTELKLGYA